MLAGMKLVAYLRVSTDSQVDRYGLDAQRQDVERWCKAHDHKVVKWCVDEGVSGTVDALDRPGLACALQALEDRLEVVEEGRRVCTSSRTEVRTETVRDGGRLDITRIASAEKP